MFGELHGRIIKYRFWNGEEMFSWEKMKRSNLLADYLDYHFGVIPMEFTDNYSIYNEEIYEGDIVECGYGRGHVIKDSGNFMVKWIDDKEANMELLSSRKWPYIRRQEDEFEVLGNIYENPELLLPKKDGSRGIWGRSEFE